MTEFPADFDLAAIGAAIGGPHPLRLGRRAVGAGGPPTRPAAPAGRAPASAPPPFPPLQAVPAPAALVMPIQDLRCAPGAGSLGSGPSGARIIVLAGALAYALLVGALLFDGMRAGGLTVMEGVTLALSMALSAWVGFGFMSAAAGLGVAWRARGAQPATGTRPGASRTAILLPTFNEDPGLVFSAVQAISEDLRRLEASDLFDVFVLSDTRDSVIARAEATALLRVRLRLGGDAGVYYRRRADNVDRKAGNIADWVETFGAAYDFMLVLDADSLMTGEAILALAAEIERDPAAGLVQSVPTIVNARTPFARLQQFASRLYGPVYAAGQQWWSGREGNYWGHNAIVRVAAFAQSAGLPHLEGRRPWGGHIMSHDFIEAALMRRRGWAIRTVAGLPGSYEEAPPTLLDTAVRDRRWCQGNLQHARLVGAAGLHWVSRLHLLLGICAYLASPLWLVLLACGAVVWSQQHLVMGSAAARHVALAFGLTLALLAAPKLMALILALSDARTRRGFGGADRLILGVAVETLASMLLTPVTMVMQAASVFDVLVGRDSGWKPQRREGVEISSKEAWRAHRGHVILGLAGALGALLIDRSLLVWAGPVFLSLALSAILSFHTSRPRAGRPDSLPRLLRIPEDANPPDVLARARALRTRYAQEASLRRQIEVFFREEPAVYEVRATAHGAVRRLAA